MSTPDDRLDQIEADFGEYSEMDAADIDWLISEVHRLRSQEDTNQAAKLAAWYEGWNVGFDNWATDDGPGKNPYRSEA